MKLKRIVAPFEIKATAEGKGSFTGYASVFGNKDLGWDVIEKGAFQEIVRNKDGKVRILYAHDDGGYTPAAGLPIGLADVEQDDHGLKVSGDLVMEDPFVQRVHTHLKAGTLDGMSIGYNVLPGGAEHLDNGVRVLKALKLWEVTICTFGMNPEARVESVKAFAAQCRTPRELENLIRDELGFSHAKAKLLVSGGWKALQSARDETDDAQATQQFLKFLNSFPTEIK